MRGTEVNREATGDDLIELARGRLGEAYRFGQQVPKNHRDWRGPWDCAEFASWLVYQVSGRLYGCDPTEPEPQAADAYTGWWRGDAARRGIVVTVAEAAATPGAFVLRTTVGGKHGHIALCEGGGGTIEARSPAHGVCRARVAGRRWQIGVLVPWITYTRGADVELSASPAILRVGSTGKKVRSLQQALLNHRCPTCEVALAAPGGPHPGPLDGLFGPLTLAAVEAFQGLHGLTVDGEVGPETRAALGLET